MRLLLMTLALGCSKVARTIEKPPTIFVPPPPSPPSPPSSTSPLSRRTVDETATLTELFDAGTKLHETATALGRSCGMSMAQEIALDGSVFFLLRDEMDLRVKRRDEMADAGASPSDVRKNAAGDEAFVQRARPTVSRLVATWKAVVASYSGRCDLDR
jgi:hypothetical protein